MIDIKATREQIKAIGDRLAALSNEAEHGFAQLTKITLGLVEELEAARSALASSRSAYDSILAQAAELRTARDMWIIDFRKLNNRATELQTEVDRLRRLEHKLDVILAFAGNAEQIANDGTREEAIKATADVMREIFADSGHGVMLPDVLDCPDGVPLHGHHDGCPSCAQATDAITRKPISIPITDLTFSQALEHLKHGSSVRRKGWATKGAHIKIHRYPDKRISDCIAWYMPDRPIQPGWTCSQADMLADDWEVCGQAEAT